MTNSPAQNSGRKIRGKNISDYAAEFYYLSFWREAHGK
jgi:hypothetical protein